MKRIIVFSDSHGRTEQMTDVLKRIPKVDYVLFLGDCLRDIYTLEREFTEIAFRYVPGNNDFYSPVSEEQVLEIDGIRIFMAHGHQYRVKTSTTTFLYRTEELECRVGLFGHTHHPFLLRQDDITVMNPGSIALPYRGQQSYGILELEKGKVCADILYL